MGAILKKNYNLVIFFMSHVPITLASFLKCARHVPNTLFLKFCGIFLMTTTTTRVTTTTIDRPHEINSKPLKHLLGIGDFFFCWLLFSHLNYLCADTYFQHHSADLIFWQFCVVFLLLLLLFFCYISRASKPKPEAADWKKKKVTTIITQIPDRQHGRQSASQPASPATNYSFPTECECEEQGFISECYSKGRKI